MLNQVIEFNMEDPEADSKKGQPRNSAVFLLNDKKVTIMISEKQFRLEFDEEAMLATLRDSAKLDVSVSASRGFDSIKKKKVPMNQQEGPKILYDKDIDFTNVLDIAEKAYPSLGFEEFELQLNDEFALTGKIKLIRNEFTKMPRG